MPTIIPVFGGRVWADQFIGALGEISINIDDKEIRINDGATPGGFIVPSVEGNNSRYQQKNPELNDFKFKDAEKGVLARTEPGVYVLRKLNSTGEAIQIEFADFQEGNPTISLSPEITSDHVFSGFVGFTQTAEFQDGIVGNLIGNVQGNLDGNVTGNVLGNLTGNVEGNLEGNVDVRGSDILFDPGQIPQVAVSGLVAALQNLLIPAGVIVIWSGAVNAIPNGWALCDGTNGTPDFSDRFIIGFSENRAQNSVGGNFSHTHPISLGMSGEHNHAITVAGHSLTIPEIPTHNHFNGIPDNVAATFNRATIAANPATANSIDNNNNPGIFEGATSDTGGGQPHAHTASSQASGGHSHLVDLTAANVIPRYYASAFIMKL